MLIAILIINILILFMVSSMFRVVRDEGLRNELAIDAVKDKLDKVFPDPKTTEYDV